MCINIDNNNGVISFRFRFGCGCHFSNCIARAALILTHTKRLRLRHIQVYISPLLLLHFLLFKMIYMWIAWNFSSPVPRVFMCLGCEKRTALNSKMCREGKTFCHDFAVFFFYLFIFVFIAIAIFNCSNECNEQQPSILV